MIAALERRGCLVVRHGRDGWTVETVELTGEGRAQYEDAEDIRR